MLYSNLKPGDWILLSEKSTKTSGPGKPLACEVLCNHPDLDTPRVYVKGLKTMNGQTCGDHPHGASSWQVPYDSGYILATAHTREELSEEEAKQVKKEKEAARKEAEEKENLLQKVKILKELGFQVGIETPCTFIEPHQRGIIFWSYLPPISELHHQLKTKTKRTVFVNELRPLVLIVPFFPKDEELEGIIEFAQSLTEEETIDTKTFEKTQEQENKRTQELLKEKKERAEKEYESFRKTEHKVHPAMIAALKEKYEFLSEKNGTITALTKPITMKTGTIRKENVGRFLVTIQGTDIQVIWEGAQENTVYHPHISSSFSPCNGNTNIQTLLSNKKYAETLIVLLDILETYSSGSPYKKLPVVRETRAETIKAIQIL